MVLLEVVDDSLIKLYIYFIMAVVLIDDGHFLCAFLRLNSGFANTRWLF